MAEFLPITIKKQSFLATASRCLYWENEKSLIISDLHIGKSGHFRKNGIGIPQNMFREDLQRLFTTLPYFKPSQLIIVGDLFHSSTNKEHDLFFQWRKDWPRLDIHLVKGNHDILTEELYQQAGLQIHQKNLIMGDFNFVHDPSDFLETSTNYGFCGHVHPGILLGGRGKQSLRLPCFHFGKKIGLLPAFGKFTGTQLITVGKSDTVFALAQHELIAVMENKVSAD